MLTANLSNTLGKMSSFFQKIIQKHDQKKYYINSYLSISYDE